MVVIPVKGGVEGKGKGKGEGEREEVGEVKAGSGPPPLPGSIVGVPPTRGSEGATTGWVAGTAVEVGLTGMLFDGAETGAGAGTEAGAGSATGA